MDKKRLLLNKTDIELDKDKLKKELQKLVADFKADDGWGKSEDGIQTHFIVKMLELLGWVGSKNVKINETQDVKTGKKPDIILKVPGSKLLVIESKEAKNRNFLDGKYFNKTFVEQLLGYLKAEGLVWGVLTNFVEWRLYNETQKCLYKEKKYAFHDLLWPDTNKNSYIDLLSDEGLDFLYRISRQSLVAKNGKIDSDPIYYPKQLDLEQEKIKKEFFSKIKNWRAKLKNWISRNYASQYNADEIDLMAQKILDRLIFMDICHDKGVINENHVQSVLSATKRTKYDELKEKFRLMDEKFNTELFAENEIDKIKINDEVMIEIIKELNDIDFAKLSVHIIGEVYENYLGELAKSRTTDEKKISDKQKQKKKAQGIYYTPDYIVDYIVKNTIGKLLENAETISEIEKIRVLDPACGSGSFLIRAFDEFLNTYRRIMKVPEGQVMWDEFIIRKKILQNNIFGVDLDAKAVEITKLNLMIKALDRIKPQDLKGNHLLPNLNLNIRCGNSLIGGEKLQGKEQSLNLFDNYKTEVNKLTELKISFHKESDDQKKKGLLIEIGILEMVINKNINKSLEKYFNNLNKIAPFNYSVAFCEIFKDGGFDAIIGNPPYGAELDDSEKEFYTNNFEVGSTDTAILFIKHSFDILKPESKFGFIVPKAFCFASNYEKIREYVWNNLEQIVDCNKVWKEVKLEQLIFIINKEKKSKKYLSANFKNKQLNILGEIDKADAKEFGFFLNSVSPDEVEIAKKIKSNSLMLNDIATNQRGAILQKYISDKGELNVIGGAQVQKYGIDGIKGKIDKNKIDSDQAYLKENSILVQRIVAHIENPIDHVMITAGIPDKADYILVDTINQITLHKEYSPYFIWCLLNSEVVNWYAYRFIFGKAIRTMQFDNPTTARLPIPKATKQEQELLIQKAKEILKLAKQNSDKDRINAVNYEIDKLVYELYGVKEDDIKIIEH
ncbi:N-6 DNA methylase [Candidatus Falkowbacteria bacterium]|nr:N-6 DNA methylase [Candidatus Falkowbacteria bacterium]